MAKIVLDDTAGGYNLSVINDNFSKIEDELQNKVYYRKNPTGEPKTLQTDMDVNDKKIYNLPTPTLPSQAARLQDVQNAIGNQATANLTNFTPYGGIAATNVQGAIQELEDEKASVVDLDFVDVRLGLLETSVFNLRGTLGMLTGVAGNGVIDDTVAIELAMSNYDSIFFPEGTYLFTGDIDLLFSKNLVGVGVVRYMGVDYAVTRKDAANSLWAGQFKCWPMAHALETETVQRMHIPAGVTQARIGFINQTTIYHVEGSTVRDAMRIQRNATTTDSAAHNTVINLTREETKPLAGRACVFQFNALKSSTFSGGALSYRVQYSVEPDQPILNSDGTYTSSNVSIVSGSLTLGNTTRPASAPYFFPFTLPVNATQVSVVFSAGFSGVAGSDDYFEIENAALYPGTSVANILYSDFSETLLKAKSRYQTSYAYGLPRGVATEQGTVGAIGVSTAINWSFALNIPFNPPMAVVPQFLFQSPTSGTESRLLNKDSGVNIQGLAFNLSDSGVTITNNAAGVVGNRYICHWTAQVIF